VQASLSRFEPQSDIACFNAAASGTTMQIGDDARDVLAAARTLADASGGVFDVSLGTGGDGWRCAGATLTKLAPGVRLDLGGIGKGHAVDRAVDILVATGVAGGWVNAGGDLRAFGAAAVDIDLRDEVAGGVHRFATLADGAFATSRLADTQGCVRHVSVAAPLCLWADALTKLVVVTGEARHPLLAGFGAQAWVHAVSAAPAGER
jgi:thiamine biosynthesis lipoprotein